MLLLTLLFSCARDTPDTPAGAPPDLTERLPDGATRAGVVTDEASLFGGISAEGRAGDVKIYNSRVAFVIQGAREGSYYLPQGGQVIDADVVRSEGQPGRDMVDEWIGMAGVGRLMRAESVEVVSDGSDGLAVVRAAGHESPLELLAGAIEADVVDDLGLELVTEYRLAPDSWFLEVVTTVTATEEAVAFKPGDGVLGSADAGSLWVPGGGYEGFMGQDFAFAGFVGKRNEGAVGVFMPTPQLADAGGLQALGELLELAAAFQEERVIGPGESASWTRWYGVGPDMATLSSAQLEAWGSPVDHVTGTVDAPDGAVAGARVVVSVDGEPFTLATTDEDGAFDVAVPAGATVDVLADGRGDGLFLDAPDGAAPFTPYATTPAREAALASLTDGAVPIPMAQARGIGTPDAPLTLGQPGRLEVRAGDGLPFEARVRFLEPDLDVDPARVRERPGGHAAAAWSRDGSVELLVEPGTYELLVHRGMRFELHTSTVVVEPGARQTVEVSLPQAFTHEGYLVGDPHSHAALSPDGGLAIEDRLMTHAGTGVQVHFATEHDHVADYRALIGPMGLTGVMTTVVATEMSPVMRGHLNLYPLVFDAALPNGGGWPWWRNRVTSTTEELAHLRDQHGGALQTDAGFVIQANHPIGVGLGDLAKWSPGRIESPSFWAEDFDAMEVLNAGSHDAYVALYHDLVARGLAPTPVGVSDSHAHFSGGVGFNVTFLGMGTSDPTAYTDAGLREAMLARRTIASCGVFLALSIDPGAVVVGPAELEVEARSASWAPVDRLLLTRDGILDQKIDGPVGTFNLDPDVDAAYVVFAEGDTPMAPAYGRTPWAMASAIFVDVDGDGWEAPLPPLRKITP